MENTNKQTQEKSRVLELEEILSSTEKLPSPLRVRLYFIRDRFEFNKFRKSYERVESNLQKTRDSLISLLKSRELEDNLEFPTEFAKIERVRRDYTIVHLSKEYDIYTHYSDTLLNCMEKLVDRRISLARFGLNMSDSIVRAHLQSAVDKYYKV